MPAEIERPKLSPDGRFLAFLARTGDTYTIGLCNLATGQTDLSKSDAKIRPIDFWWKTPSRLLVQVSNVKLNELSYAILISIARSRRMRGNWNVSRGGFSMRSPTIPSMC